MKKKLTALAMAALLLLSATACSGETADTTTATTTNAPVATTTKKPTTLFPPDTSDPDDFTDESELFIPYGSATVDGTKEDAWANAAKVSLDLTKKDNPNADTVVEASVMWNENGLYFLFEITDSDIYTGGTVGDFNNDGIYLYIAEDPLAYYNAFASFADGTYQFALIADEKEMLPRHGDKSAELNAQSAYTRTEDGMIIEFCYTPANYPVAAGNFLLLDFQYNDSGASGTRAGGIGWYNGTDTNADTGLWAIVKLLAQGEVAPE